MPLHIVKGDILSIQADALIYAEASQAVSFFNFNPFLYNEKGREVLKSREAVHPLFDGHAKIAPVSNLEAGYVIHTSPPVWHGGYYHELNLLQSCYEKSFQLAAEHHFTSVALPIIATNKLGYMKSVTQKMALDCIREFLNTHDMTIYLLLEGKTGIMLSGNLFTSVNKYLSKHFVAANSSDDLSDPCNSSSFVTYLSQRMKDTNLSEEELARKANLSQKVLSGILKGNTENILKNRVAALGMALTLNQQEMTEFLASAGYALTPHSKFDLIIEYCISQNIYDLLEINQILFRFEQPQLL